MKKQVLFLITLLFSVLHINAQSNIIDTIINYNSQSKKLDTILKLREQPKRDGTSISVDLTKPTDTLFFDMDLSTEEVSNTVNFNLAKGNKFDFGQVTMKAHEINPFNLPKIYLNKKAMNLGIYLPNLNQDAIFTIFKDSESKILDIKSPKGENAAELSFVFSKKDLVEGNNQINVIVNKNDNQEGMAITDLKLFLRAPLNNDKVITITQISAEFQGGPQGWMDYLQNNLNLDVPLKNEAPAGIYSVIVSFIVDKEGNITEVKAENDPGYGTKEETLRVIKKAPKWKPASQNGVNVIYRHRQTVGFIVSNK